MDEAALRRALADERRIADEQRRSLGEEFDAVVSGSEGSNGDDEHDPEGATVAFERSRVSALLSRATERIEAIEAAIARLDTGDFGRCRHCGATIGADRLAARPSTTVCIGCASRSTGSVG